MFEVHWTDLASLMFRLTDLAGEMFHSDRLGWCDVCAHSLAGVMFCGHKLGSSDVLPI